MRVKESAVKKALRALMGSEIRIRMEAAEGELPVGASRIGGAPDGPAGFTWPYYEIEDEEGAFSVPLAFLGQFDLAEAAPLDEAGLLPKEGLLSFWYELQTCPMGFGPADLGAARAFLFPAGEALTGMEAPEDLPEECRIGACRVAMTKEVSLPAFPDFPIPDDWEEELAASVYERSRELLGYDEDLWGFNTKLLGYPDTITDPMEWVCEAVSRDVSLYDEGEDEALFDLSEDLLEEIDAGCEDWVLLFQLGTVEERDFDLEFGSCGHLYFWIRRQDLAAGRFDRVQAVLQSRD